MNCGIKKFSTASRSSGRMGEGDNWDLPDAVMLAYVSWSREKHAHCVHGKILGPKALFVRAKKNLWAWSAAWQILTAAMPSASRRSSSPSASTALNASHFPQDRNVWKPFSAQAPGRAFSWTVKQDETSAKLDSIHLLWDGRGPVTCCC